MIRVHHSFRSCAGVCLGVLLLARPQLVPAADSIVWRGVQDRFDAEIASSDLPKLLEQIGDATGWQVYVDPEAKLERPASTRFNGLPKLEALKRLLGELNFRLDQLTNAPSKLSVYRHSPDQATQRVRTREKPRPAKAIPNELLLTLRGGSSENADSLARRLGAKILGRADGRNAYRLQFADEAAAKAAQDQLAGNADVTVDYNFPIQRPQEPDGQMNATLPPLNISPNAGPDSSRLIVGLIDTAVQNLGAPYNAFMLPGISVADGTAPPEALPTHGTSMLETVLRGLSRAPSESNQTPVRILPIDVYGGSVNTTTFDVANGVAAAVNGGASIINLSLGSEGDSEFLHNPIREAFNRGVFVIAAAGNEPTGQPFYPAAWPEVLAVTANTASGQLASYANFGPFVDVAAPGRSFVSFSGKTYSVSGTSVSTAYMSGFAAGLASMTGKTPLKTAPQLIQAFPVNSAGGR